MATVADSDTGRPPSIDHSGEGALARLGLRFTNLAEHWFPDAYVFVCLAVAVVAAAAMLNGAAPMAVAKSFGDGFWSLITFTMQMAIVAIGGYVVASSPPAARRIDGLAAMPRSGAGAVACVAAVSMLTSLLSWGLSLIFSGLLVRVLARRADLRMDYRAAGAAASWPRRDLGARAQLIFRAAAGERGELAKVAAADHGRHSVLGDDLSLAIAGHRACSHLHFDRAGTPFGAVRRDE